VPGGTLATLRGRQQPSREGYARPHAHRGAQRRTAALRHTPPPRGVAKSTLCQGPVRAGARSSYKSPEFRVFLSGRHHSGALRHAAVVQERSLKVLAWIGRCRDGLRSEGRPDDPVELVHSANPTLGVGRGRGDRLHLAELPKDISASSCAVRPVAQSKHQAGPRSLRLHAGAQRERLTTSASLDKGVM
jgi:hypothetical protein